MLRVNVDVGVVLLGFVKEGMSSWKNPVSTVPMTTVMALPDEVQEVTLAVWGSWKEQVWVPEDIEVEEGMVITILPPTSI